MSRPSAPGTSSSDASVRRIPSTPSGRCAPRWDPTRRIVFVIGRDAFDEFHTWKEPATIFALCDVVVITRPPWPDTLSPDDLRVAIPQPFDYDPRSGTIRHASGRAVSLQRITALDISATAIRHMVSAGRSIQFLVPAAVASYIATSGLYTTGAEDQSL